jgi:DNA-binding HxlR family transcriptional regulator
VSENSARNRTHFRFDPDGDPQNRYGAWEGEGSSGYTVSMLRIGNKWNGFSGWTACRFETMVPESGRSRDRSGGHKKDRTRKRRSGKAVLTVVAGSGDASAIVNPHLAMRFREFANRCSDFSKEVVEASGTRTTTTSGDNARLNLRIARTMFGKWSVEILTFLYSTQQARFQEIKKALGEISARVLSLKLTRLEGLGLVRRTVLDTKPPGVEYSLTDKGLQAAKLGEPVFLYLRLTEGLLNPVSP